MTTVIVGMLLALVLALGVVALVAVPARREGREPAQPRGRGAAVQRPRPRRRPRQHRRRQGSPAPPAALATDPRPGVRGA
nr:hypothetical protein [Angustibacter aerolatus]